MFRKKKTIEMYSAHNVGKSMEKVFEFNIKKLDHTVSKFNNTYDRVKPVDVKSSTYIHFSKEVNDEGLNFKIGDIVRTSKCKNNFAKGSV